MRVLIIVGDCLEVNTSANMCHLAYISGFVELGAKVTLISADKKDYLSDESLQIPREVKSITYPGMTLYEKLSQKKRQSINVQKDISVPNAIRGRKKTGLKRKLEIAGKKTILALYGPHGIYSKMIRSGKKFTDEEPFDYVVSLSTPPSSHALAYNLLHSGKIITKCWIQIWEDPWFSDAYGFNEKKNIYSEEKRILANAEKVCYVSPLTLIKQRQLFPESAHKMYWNPLPYYYKRESSGKIFVNNSYGYFGDYAPAARNLKPFYEAAIDTEIKVNICGNPSNLFSSTDRVHIHPRLPLNELKQIEDDTNVLVFLCNRKGGQIPGKIYQYSATNKIILFILDGTPEEMQVLKEFFSKYKRYVFCENNVDSIKRAILKIESGHLGDIENEPVEAFNPKDTVFRILEG